jgi:uncharacterized heparinase superfamily protein
MAFARLLYPSPLYRLLLSGGTPKAPKLLPAAPPRGQAERGRAILAGEELAAAPDWHSDDAALCARLNGFAWLADLAAVGTPEARARARNLVGAWLELDRWHPTAWAPGITGRRIAIALQTWTFVTTGGEEGLAGRWLASLSRQAKHLARSVEQGEDGFARLEAVVGLVHAALADLGKLDPAQAIERLQRELARQILPDGGHVERAPQLQVEAFALLVDLRESLLAAGLAQPTKLEAAIERMARMLRFFRHQDGKLALFNGSLEGDARAIDRVLQRSGIKTAAPLSAPESGFERLAAARTLVIFNGGAPPPPTFDRHAHAGQLSFELSVGRDRVVVNCGAAPPGEKAWSMAARATAAHSTLVVDDTNSAELKPEGGMARRPRRLEAGREDGDGASWVSACHDGYAPNFGLVHRRRLFLSPDGTDLRGEDVLNGTHRGQFAVRFHLHPEVQVSLIQNGGAALLRTATGVPWRLHVGGGRLELAQTVYLGQGKVRRSEQLVISGAVVDGATIKWAFRMLPRT